MTGKMHENDCCEIFSGIVGCSLDAVFFFLYVDMDFLQVMPVRSRKSGHDKD